jgi:orotate phosphoribosyltransferase
LQTTRCRFAAICVPPYPFQNLKHPQPGQRVFIVDDLLGSGTTMQVHCLLANGLFLPLPFVTDIDRQPAISSKQSAALLRHVAVFVSCLSFRDSRN